MVACVLVELSNKSIDKTFDYLVPSKLEDKIKVGIRVTVPFGNQVLEGFVLKLKENSELELKSIINVIDDEVVLNEELLNLGKFISNKTLSTLISAYQVMLPKALKAQVDTEIREKYEKYLSIANDDIQGIKLSENDIKIIDILRKEKRVKKNSLTNISAYSVKKLLDKNIIKEELIEVYRLQEKEYANDKNIELTHDQKNAIDKIITSSSNTILLHGVTGSGKTEVYVQLIRKMLAENKTSIVLVPEISLTPQVVSEFKSRFTCGVAVLHSRLSDGERYDEYRKIVKGEVKIVIGARSAVFAPLKNIGIIIIDEEHTTSYKQDSNPKYNAIDVAIERCKYHNAKLVLGSATPTLESYSRALKNVYELVELPNRINSRPMPNVLVLDMNKEKKNSSYFSNSFIEKINDRLSKKEQVIILLNRRGYASFITCSNCGYVEKCPHCDITLTFHKTSKMLRCHYCGYATKILERCPNCREDAMKSLGVGTEKIEEELNNLFNCRVVRMDLDTTTKKGSHEKIIEDFRNHKYDILLGTQMIAKGLDFANVTLVGVINADTSLMIPNYKSSEYTFQLLCQVSGRSGSGEKPGEVVIQTFNPDHYAIAHSKKHDYLNFYKDEMAIRKKLGYSPYFYIASLKILSKDYDLAKEEANNVSKYLRSNLLAEIVLGPSVASVFRVNDVYRFNIIIKYKKDEMVYKALNRLIDHYKTNNKVKLDINFNPNNL